MAIGVAKTKTTELSREDIRRLCGDILDWKVDAIIATGAGFEELEEAVAWASGQDDEWLRRGNHSPGWLQSSTICSRPMTN